MVSEHVRAFLLEAEVAYAREHRSASRGDGTEQEGDVSERYPMDSKLIDPASGKEIRLTSYAACAG